ncbi:3-isopropylmalate dehydratase small subunit [Sphingomonas dokdonensis]|uniref:3-isopropylmalate dehydratase n=1 Tax=Sphingomonas dokdonensis TaxID=344880 RepID=A0A245ZMQ3_9SPHN|nr:3-isopropylmalate dehydratase small subunit [Sphingomonas dokdonensis]OWK31017.1 3-isopropylmalate dehydratase small subunit 1 [Sphingomonas dokdonensis]
MTPWRPLSARAAVLASPDIDTDKILPARFMKGLERHGLGVHLFADVRTGDPAYALAADRAIIVAGRNFGSGSSREHAVWALTGHGIRCVIAPSFGSIFAGNAASNGLLLATVSDADLATLADHLAAVPDAPVAVDLHAQEIRTGNIMVGFAIDPAVREALIAGLDDIGRTLRHQDAIAAYEAAH